jgi:hypothetical protein
MDLVKGRRYRIRFKRDQDSAERTCVMDLMSVRDREFVFNARPLGGTQTFPRRWVREMIEAEESEIQLPRR